MTDLLAALQSGGHERLIVSRDPSAGYTGIIAIHSTALGPAVGGTRLRTYESFDDALADALRLARGMTYKNAMAGLPFGGGKSVLLGPAPADRAAFFRAHGRAVHQLGGAFRTGEDVGTSPDDMAVMAEITPYVAGLETGAGDPSPFTARGVVRAMQAAAREAWGSDSLAGRTVAIQGLGHVGGRLADELATLGARLVVADVDEAPAAAIAAAHGATVVAPDVILATPCDILAPCALGGVLDDASVAALNARIVCGAANNQLADSRHDAALADRGILYVPDYVANAGGVISGSVDLAGWNRSRMVEAIDAIYDTVRTVVTASRSSGDPTGAAADRIAEARLAEASAK
jgi:leucine dehydrogenase